MTADLCRSYEGEQRLERMISWLLQDKSGVSHAEDFALGRSGRHSGLR
jgi:hypothetical protein